MNKRKVTKSNAKMPKSVYKKGGYTSMKSVKAPAIAQHMASDIYRHTGKFTPHKGASLVAKFKVQKLHKK